MALKVTHWMALAALAASCGGPAAEPAPAPALDALSVTRWTARTELFAEYAPLVAGRTSRFAIHLTRLDTFDALPGGRVEVHLTGGDRPPEVFSTVGPSRPGIFGVDVAPVHDGPRELTIALHMDGLDDEHRVGAVMVHPDEAAARNRPPDEPPAVETISFLKEQQWSLDFGTVVVSALPVRASLRVPALIVARPGGAADVRAPIDGRLVVVSALASGAVVSRGQELARVQPPPGTAAELPQLRQARAESAAALQFATRDRERAERLVAAGAAPHKRLDETQTAEAQARARVESADAMLAQYTAARTAGSSGPDDALFVLRSPIAGVIAERTATTGANVSSGELLFRVVDANLVQVAGQVSEGDVAAARRAESAEIEVSGHHSRTPAGARVNLGRVLDPLTRTVPIVFALDNRPLGLVVGQSVFLHLLLDATEARPAVPASAIVDDGGRPIVFVQRGGEAFERRAVTLGARAGDTVQVVEGLSAGERVVSVGAYLIRLASLSTQVPSHGHVH